MESSIKENASRTSAVRALAVVGFISLIALGISLAVYATRYVPTVANKIGTAAVYIGSVFGMQENGTLAVVPNGSTTPATLPLPSATSTAPVATTTLDTATTPAASPAPEPVLSQPVIKQPTAPYGLPDLTAVVTDTGYLTTTSVDSFVSGKIVPKGMRPAVRFSVINAGTNVSGIWRFSASIPTRSTFVYQSGPQQSVAPGDSIDYTLGFDLPQTGANLPLSITLNPDSTFAESNTQNNTATATFTVAD